MPVDTLSVLYRLASVFVFPSLYEGFGLPPLEAMASGTPVVTSNVSSLPEVVGDAAILVDPYDPDSIAEGMKQALTDTELRATLIARGLAKVREYLLGAVGRAHQGGLRGGHAGTPAGMTRPDDATARVPAPAASGHRVALVHDWLTGMRGGEKVLEVLCELFPRADLFTMVYVPGSVSPVIEAMRPKGALLSHFPRISNYYRHCLPLFPFVVEQFDLDCYDLVLSTSHCAVKSVVRPGSARHLCYCHTPMRYVWDQRDAYFGAAQVGRVRAALLRPLLARLARWDQATASRVDRYVANSEHVARRIGRYYNRRARVIHPPVDTVFYHPDGRPPGRSALVVSALAPYKRLDVAIEACRLAHVPLRIVGWGLEQTRLSAQAGDGVEFLGVRTDEEIRELYRDCGAVLLPGEEDFGIVPVEAQACGRPVVALARGGALETVIDGATGVLVADGPEPLAEGLCRALDAQWDPDAMRSQAERFGRPRFASRMMAEIDDLLGAPAD